MGYSDRKALEKKANEVSFECLKEFEKKYKGLNSLKEQARGNLENILKKERKYLFFEVDSIMHIQEMKKVKKKEEELQQRIKELTESSSNSVKSLKRNADSPTFYSAAKRQAVELFSRPVRFAKIRCTVF